MKFAVIAPAATFCFYYPGDSIEIRDRLNQEDNQGRSEYIRTNRVHKLLETLDPDVIVLDRYSSHLPDGRLPLDWADWVIGYGEAGYFRWTP